MQCISTGIPTSFQHKCAIAMCEIKMAVAVEFGVAQTEELNELERELLELCSVDVEDVSIKKRDFCKRCR